MKKPGGLTVESEVTRKSDVVVRPASTTVPSPTALTAYAISSPEPPKYVAAANFPSGANCNTKASAPPARQGCSASGEATNPPPAWPETYALPVASTSRILGGREFVDTYVA